MAWIRDAPPNVLTRAGSRHGSSAGCGVAENLPFQDGQQLQVQRPGDRHRRDRVEDVLSLAEERDHDQAGTSAIRCSLGEPAYRTRVPIRGHHATPSGRDLT